MVNGNLALKAPIETLVERDEEDFYLLTLRNYSLNSIVPRTLYSQINNTKHFLSISVLYLLQHLNYRSIINVHHTRPAPIAYTLYVSCHHWAAARVFLGHVALQMEAFAGQHNATSENTNCTRLFQLIKLFTPLHTQACRSIAPHGRRTSRIAAVN